MKKNSLFLGGLVLVSVLAFGFVLQKKGSEKVSTDGFSIVFPSSFSSPVKDSTFIDTYYGQGQFITYVSQNKTGALMAGVQKYGDASFIGLEDGVILDTIQQQMIRVMSGTSYRQYKVKRNGMLSRVTYFTAKAIDSSLTHWRLELVINKPKIYQIAYTSTDKSKLNAKEINGFFKSFSLKK